ncbi:hypothetical protein [Lysinibacillus sp. CTST325]
MKIRDIRRRLYLHSAGTDTWTPTEKKPHTHPYHTFYGNSFLLNEDKNPALFCRIFSVF